MRHQTLSESREGPFNQSRILGWLRDGLQTLKSIVTGQQPQRQKVIRQDTITDEPLLNDSQSSFE